MTFGQSISTCFRKYSVFVGRASRSEFWWWLLFTFLVRFVGIFTHFRLDLESVYILIQIFLFALLLPTFTVAVRRCHDSGHSGWWLFCPIFNIVLMFLPTKESQQQAYTESNASSSFEGEELSNSKEMLTSNQNMPCFVDHNDYVINEKFAYLNNEYEVLDEKGSKIGMICVKRSFLQSQLNIFQMELQDADGKIIATIEKKRFWCHTVDVYDKEQQKLGYFDLSVGWRTKLDFYNPQGQEILKLKHNAIVDNNDTVLATIIRRYSRLLNSNSINGVDEYTVHIDKNVKDKTLRVLIASYVGVYDVIYQDKKLLFLYPYGYRQMNDALTRASIKSKK